MKKLLVFCVNSMIAIWFLLLWGFQMILASDMPVSISFDEMQSMVLTLLVSTIITAFYVKIIPDTHLYFFLTLPTLIWGFSMVNSISKNYHVYDTIITVSGFMCSIFIFIILYLNARRLSKLS
ncbi:hypothetical protein [Brevibacillus brevis]|uniref:hypothetical protein n=1 Tax=Brevibacillus brevis TaxID=1393 RepID=UPI000E36B7F7|nr:hypothetical protein [Brevibacillus brevis]RED28335.1 hypothetical protein DES34_108198 [Brevibacillus brevis]GEC93794.1 hypothetical protein BBR01nite_61250 [Brevibacillus brevis]VEF91030.1 Uncharacterised protein [Brevibacillus brevis]